MIGVGVQRDLVILYLPGRRRDVLLRCRDAEQLADLLEQKATEAEVQPAGLYRGEPWECGVVSYDGTVAICFVPPHVGQPTRVPLPPPVARQLADRVTFASQQAAYKMRFAFER